MISHCRIPDQRLVDCVKSAKDTKDRYKRMQDDICRRLGFTSLSFNRLDDMIEAIGVDPENLCTYCWNGKE